MSKKKKAVKKTTNKSVPMVDSEYYVKLTREQFDKIDDFINWGNSISELLRIKNFDSDVSNIELAFFVGSVHNKLESEFEEISNLINEIKPNDSDDEITFEDDEN